MAETLGSLVDKLTIKDIRECHVRQMLNAGDKKFSRRALTGKLQILAAQKRGLVKAIDAFIVTACTGTVLLKDEKIKLYNALRDMGRIPRSKSLGGAISGLANKNLELRHLEDEARRTDVGLQYIGTIKRKIDVANQQRNDFIDKIDELFAEKLRKNTKGAR